MRTFDSRAAILVPLFALFGLFAGACRRSYQVGDHVLVDWRGGDFPAVIVTVEGPAKFRVHYDGYGDDWDETIPGTRIQSRLGQGAAPPPGPNARAKPMPSASAQVAPPALSVYRVGDRVRVEWHGAIYSANVISVLGGDRYRVHYDGHGPEWDEDVGLNRIQRK